MSYPSNQTVPDMKDSLSGLQKEWDEARRKIAGQPSEARPNRSGPIPDGKYRVLVEELKLTRTKTNKTPMLTWKLLIMDGDQRGRHEWYNKVISAQSIEYVVKDLQMCGIDLGDLANLAAYLPQARGVELDIRIESKHERRNVYFNRRLDRSYSGDAENHEIETLTDGTDFPIE